MKKAKSSPTSQLSEKVESKSPSSLTNNLSIAKNAERFFLTEGIKISIIDSERRLWNKYDSVDIVMLLEGSNAKFKSISPKIFHWVRRMLGLSDALILQSFGIDEDSVIKIGESLFSSADGKYLIYSVTKEHFEDIRDKAAKMNTHYEKPSFLLPYLHLFSFEFEGQERYYTMTPAFDKETNIVYGLQNDLKGVNMFTESSSNAINTTDTTASNHQTNSNSKKNTKHTKHTKHTENTENTENTKNTSFAAYFSSSSKRQSYYIDESSPTGNVRFPMLAKERKDILSKLARDIAYLTKQNKIGYKLLVGVGPKVARRPRIQVWIVDYHKSYIKEGGSKKFFRFGKTKVKTPEEYARWLLETFNQHIEVVEGGWLLANFETKTLPPTSYYTRSVKSLKSIFKKGSEIFLNKPKALLIAELGYSLSDAENKKQKKYKKLIRRLKLVLINAFYRLRFYMLMPYFAILSLFYW